ncbi:MAG TPA: SDR family NAD(P)-dependent oxidoreductase [Ktedonobacterales bacterium]|nr:SDR family NAD(P)-dependent oxidoreductase [Ktedonobacterales bacterium]
MDRLEHKVVIVTGATAGIGLATARILAARGARVVAVGHRQAALDRVAAELPGALPLLADLARPEEARTMVEAAHSALGRIDVLINNAGQGYEATVAEADAATYAELYGLNVLGPLAAMHAAIPHMRRAGGGRIINVCSPVARMALPGLGLYASTKAALRVLTLTARGELARDGIVVSLFYPYVTQSSFGERTYRSGNAAPLPFGDAMPDPDSPEFTAGQLVAAIGGSAKEVSARSMRYIALGMLRKRLARRARPR